MGSQLKASVDIGSNTVLLLVGEVHGERVQVIDELQYAPRLGKGVDANENLSKDSILRVIEILKDFQSFLSHSYPQVEYLTVTATSAVRDANNRTAFLKRVKQETGLSIQLLSGKEEAAFTFYGAKSVLEKIPGPCCVLDIGGGSTEIAIGSKSILSDRFSYDIGSVRLTERYLKDDPPSESQIEECRLAVKKAFKKKLFHFPMYFSLVGVAGTATSLAHIDAGLATYMPAKINGYVLPLNRIEHWISVLKTKSSDQLLEQYPTILKGRSDVFLAGLLILQTFMVCSNIAEVTVSTGGIRHGALLLSKQKKRASKEGARF